MTKEYTIVYVDSVIAESEDEAIISFIDAQKNNPELIKKYGKIKVCNFD